MTSETGRQGVECKLLFPRLNPGQSGWRPYPATSGLRTVREWARHTYTQEAEPQRLRHHPDRLETRRGWLR